VNVRNNNQQATGYLLSAKGKMQNGYDSQLKAHILFSTGYAIALIFALFNKAIAVEVCDATRLHSITIA